MSFQLTAPGTDIRLQEVNGQLVGESPTNNGATFTTSSADIWDLLRPGRHEFLDTFATAYAAVRAAEERTMTPAEICELPNVRPDHPLASMWQQRAQSYERFVAALAHTTPTTMVDIGAGCGWLAADLARRSWHCAAVDVTVDGGDGLAAARHHQAELLLARAEMEALPFASASVGLAVFNASLHYAANVQAALTEAARIVQPGGQLVVLDSPVFNDPAAGAAMVNELGAHLLDTVGHAAAEHEGPGFVTTADIATLPFRRINESSGLKQRVHQWRGARRAGRETAARPLLIATIGEST